VLMNTTYGKRFQKAFQEARTSAAWQEEGIRLDFVEFVIKYMAQQGLTENDMDMRLQKPQGYTHNLLSLGSPLLTIETMALLCNELGCEIQLVLSPQHKEV
jgi:hypothetical protein